MYYNNLNGCSDACTKDVKPLEINTWEIEDCKKCVSIKGSKGSFKTKELCNGALAILNKYCKSCGHCSDRYDCINGTCVLSEKGEYGSYDECSKACHKYSCASGRGCIPDFSGEFSHLECLKSCTLWDCNNNKCIITKAGQYKSENLCTKSCSRWGCEGNTCVQKENGKYASKSECENSGDCLYYGCIPGHGCIKHSKGIYPLKSECLKACSLFGPITSGACCSENPIGMFDSLAACIENNRGYSCEDGCSFEICGGKYPSKADCLKACTPWKCNLGKGCKFVVNEAGIKGYTTKALCVEGCKEHLCIQGKGCVLDVKGTQHLEECKQSCIYWGCNTGCMTKSYEGIYGNQNNCNKACKPWKCTSTGCINVTDGTGEFETKAECLLSCLSYNCTSKGCAEQIGNGGTYKSISDCQNICTSYDCTSNGCIEKEGNSGEFSTKSSCITSCKPWECTNNLGCQIAPDNKGSYSSKSECESSCKYTCNTNVGCTQDDKGEYSTMDICVKSCNNYECMEGTCIKSHYGPHQSKAECIKSCKAPTNPIRYPKRANGVWFIGENYSFKGFQNLDHTLKSDWTEYEWLKDEKINVISLAFANPYSILVKGNGDNGADSDGLPVGMSKVIKYLNYDNYASKSEKGIEKGQKRVVMISVGGWNNSVCSTNNNNNTCQQTPCKECAKNKGCGCDTSFTRGPCKDISGYCSGNACCGITSFAGPWPAIPKGNDEYQKLIPSTPPTVSEQSSYDEFGGVKICDMAIDGCKAESCNDNWYKSFTDYSNASTVLGERFADIAKKYRVGIEIDYEPQCGWGKCTYCNDHNNYLCTPNEGGITFTCTDSSSTTPFMQNVVDAFNKGIGSKFKGDTNYQPGPNNPLTLDCGGGAWWLTDVFEFAQRNIHGINYSNNNDPTSNKMTVANIMVDSVPIGSMNGAVTCSPSFQKACLSKRACDYAALTSAWLWSTHFIKADTSNLKDLWNIKSANGYTVNDLSAFENHKVLYANNPIYKGFYQTPGVPNGFKLLNSERTSISIFCGDGPKLKPDWNEVYDPNGCGKTPDSIPPTVDILFDLLSKKIDDDGNNIFYPGPSDNTHNSKGKIGGIMYWGAGKDKDGKYLGASDIDKGGEGVCLSIKASFDVLNSTYKSSASCTTCGDIDQQSCKSSNNINEMSRYWKRYKGDIPKGIEIITYSCGSGTCGDWALKGTESDLELLNGCTQIINPWVTTIDQSDCRPTGNPSKSELLLENTCYTEPNKTCAPSKMNTFLEKNESCIKAWGGKKILSLGGWAEGYTFSQERMKEDDPKGYVPADSNGPIKRVVPCFDSTETICSDHPSTNILPKGKNWGYWCFTKSDIDLNKTGIEQGGVGCDGGTGNYNPEDCWNWLAVEGVLQDKFINYATNNNYTGVDVDYEPNGSLPNQPFNAWYVYNVSKLASNKKLDITMAPLQNFFIDNKNWDVVQYEDGNYDTIKYNSSNGYYCEKAGGYGNALFSLHQKGIHFYSIFIQFYNNPPSVCDATVGNENYCVTCGSLGTVKAYGPKASTINTDTNYAGKGGLYYTIGDGCDGGVVTKGQSTDFKLLQCNYSENKGDWAWQKANYHYAGEKGNLTGSFCGDPMGNYIKDSNTWLTISRKDDEPWHVKSKGGKNNEEPLILGGIKNTIMIMLLAKSYQPNAIIAYGTVPPQGGNCSNLSSNNVIDLYRYLFNLENEIKNDICSNSKSPLLCELMTELYNGNRLRMAGMDDNYWTKNWGGKPNTDKFCTKYPGSEEGKLLFGGLGAWSTYWTEEKESNNKTWIENIKDDFGIKPFNISSCNKACDGIKYTIPDCYDNTSCHKFIENVCGNGNQYKGSICNSEEICQNNLKSGQTITYCCDPSNCKGTNTLCSKGTYVVKAHEICSKIANNICPKNTAWYNVICSQYRKGKLLSTNPKAFCPTIRPNDVLHYNCDNCTISETPINNNISWCAKITNSGLKDNFPPNCNLICKADSDCTDPTYSKCYASNGTTCPHIT